MKTGIHNLPFLGKFPHNIIKDFGCSYVFWLFLVGVHFFAAQKGKCLTDAKIISSLDSFLMNGFELLQH